MIEKREKVREALNQRWWDTQLRIYHRKINRVKHYGTKALMERYAQLIQELFKPFHERLNELLSIAEETFNADVKEVDIISYILGNLGKVTFSSVVLKEVYGIIEQTFNRGARRVFTRTGQKIQVGEVKNKAPLEALMRQQINYLKDMEEDIRERVKDILVVDLKEGKSLTKIKKDITETTQKITRHRAETIARSEIIKASTEGTKQSMKEAGIEKYLWLTARDNRVCDICREKERGSPYKFDSPDAPMPVKDSHPNCRCTIIADI